MRDLIIATIIQKHSFIPSQSEACQIISEEEEKLGGDVKFALTSTAASLASAAVLLGTGTIAWPILIPIAFCAGTAIATFNLRSYGKKAEREMDFLEEHPEVLAGLSAMKDQLNQQTATHLYNQMYRRYRLGEDDQQILPEAPTPRTILSPAPRKTDQKTHIQSDPINPSDFLYQEEPVPQLPAPTKIVEPNLDRRQALISDLRRDCPEILKLIRSHPIRVVGVQRSGKSTLAKIIALLRMVLIPGHKVIASTPHYEPENPYPSVFRVVGVSRSGRDYAAIASEWEKLRQRVLQNQTGSNTTIWDEFGLYDQVMAEEQIKSLLTSCLRETMKFGEHPIFIVHGETAAFLPGSKGIHAPFIDSTIRVEAIGQPVPDELGLEVVRPTGKFRIKELDRTESEGQLPPWLTEKFLLDMLGSTVSNQTPDQTSDIIHGQPPAEQSPSVNESLAIIPNQILDLINQESDPDRREALSIAYKWAANRTRNGKSVNREAFCDRARSDRSSTYLKDNKESIWDDLEYLLDLGNQ